MLSTTTSFDNAAVENIRKPKALVRITWSDPIIDSGLSFSTNGENNVSDKPHTANVETNVIHNWFLLNGNSLLDGTYELFPTAPQTIYEVGWYGNELSDGSGEFVTDPTLQVNFTAKAIETVLLVGNTATFEYPVDFKIQVRTGTTDEITPIEVFGNNQMWYSATANVASANNLLLTIYKWSATGTVVKIAEFYSSIVRTYYGDVVKSVNILEEREIRDSTNPIGNISCNECQVELQNVNVDGIIDPFFPGNTDSTLYTLLKPGRKIQIEFGFELANGSTEYVKMGTYWSGDFTIKDTATTISFSGRDRMELLRKASYDDNTVQSSQSFYDLLEDVIYSAQNKIPQLLYDNDTTLSSINIPTAYLERKNYFETLKYIMAGCGGQIFMSRNDRLTIESSDKSTDYSGSPDLFINKWNYFTKDQPSHYEDVINKIEIKVQPHYSTATQTVYESNDNIILGASSTNLPLEIIYNTFPVSGVTDSDVTLTTETGSCVAEIAASEYYSWGCILTIEETSGNSGTFSIEIEGTIHEVKGELVAVSEDSNSQDENGLKTYRLPDNKLIQNYSEAQGIADDLIDFYKDPRNDLNLTWRGNPALELGDIIVVPEYQRGSINTYARFKVYKLQTNYDGTLKQIISARRIDIYTP